MWGPFLKGPQQPQAPAGPQQAFGAQAGAAGSEGGERDNKLPKWGRLQAPDIKSHTRPPLPFARYCLMLERPGGARHSGQGHVSMANTPVAPRTPLWQPCTLTPQIAGFSIHCTLCTFWCESSLVPLTTSLTDAHHHLGSELKTPYLFLRSSQYQQWGWGTGGEQVQK